MLMGRLRNAWLACLRPLGYLAFVVSVAALSLAARLLGEDDALGYFAGRLSESIGRYPEVTRRGVQTAWLTWAGLFGLALSPWDPIASRWDEVALLAIAAAVAWKRLRARSTAEH
jgi:hypothetical protein